MSDPALGLLMLGLMRTNDPTKLQTFFMTY